MSASKNRSLDWSRCAEGFADFDIDRGGSTTKKRAEPVKRKSAESAFSHGNIFEKLAFGYEEEKSQSITWSSSEDEKEKEVNIIPVVKKPKRQTTPKKSAPARRSTRSSNRSQKSQLPEDMVEIIDLDDDTESFHTSKPLKDKSPVKIIKKKLLRNDSVEIIDLEKETNIKDEKSKKRSQMRLPDDSAEIIDLENDSDIVATSQPTQDATSVKSDDLTGIHGYDSDLEIAVEKERCLEGEGKASADQKTKESESQVSIYEDSSQNSTSPVTQTGTGVKGSDWVKSLQLKTPSKSEYHGEKLEPEDSAKKRKKHSKGGLAEQLSRLQSRDKSAVRMWYHQQGKPSASQDSKSIQLEVVGYENLYSMQLVKCILYKTPNTGQPGNDGTEKNLGEGKEDKVLQATNLTNEGNSEEKRLVMFPASQSEQLNLQIGSRFKIFPPWQQLELNDGQQILLCTKYCHVVQQPDVVPVNIHRSDVKLKNVVSAKWNCPCVQGLCRSQTLCPAYQFPTVPGQFQETVPAQEGTSTQGKDSNSNLLKSSDKPPTSHLYTVSSKPCDSLMSDTGRSLTESSICDSLLKSIEACRTAVDGGGDGYSGTVSFSGHVHRAVTVRNGSSKTRCHLLVEDKFGSICEIQLSTKSLTKAGFSASSCESNTFRFSGLTVHDRFIRDRHEGLFTMIDSVWSGKCIVDSQDSCESQNMMFCLLEQQKLLHTQSLHITLDIRLLAHQIATRFVSFMYMYAIHGRRQKKGRMAEPPGFCYILHETDSSPFSIEPCSSNILPSKTPVYIQLSEVWKSEAMRRTSCLVKVFYIHTKETTNMLYVTDYSLKKLQSYSMIQVSNACDFPAKLSSLSERAILILRDLFLSQGELRADEYTSISLSTDMLVIDASMSREISQLQQVAIDVTDIHKGVTENDLCIIKGHISEVDEDSAYSWEACVYCGSDQLQGDSSQGTTKCLACKKTMEEPSTKMKMEVIVTCEKSNIQAKVDLLQMTIENLLPADEVDEEGYELSSVLGKKIGPLKCVVLSSNSDTFVLKEIDLLK